MSELFGRKVRVIVGPQGGEGQIIEGLRTTFNVGKTKKKGPNTGKIEIYNMDPTLAAQLESARRGNTVQLFCGYEDGPFARIFSGEIRRGRATTTRGGVDRITRIEGKDGGRPYRSARISRSFARQVTGRQIINELGRAFGVRIRVPDSIADVVFSEGFVASGAARDVMESLALQLGFDWFFEDGVVRISPKGRDDGSSAILLTSATGLLSYKKTNKGVSGVALLNPEIRPKRLVELREPDARGFYIVQRTQHKGDSGYAKSFYTEFEARFLGR